MDITLKIKTAVAQCFGVQVSLDQPVHMKRDDFKELDRLGLNDSQVYAFIYQRIQEEEIYEGLLDLETESDTVTLRLEQKNSQDGGELHLKVIKRKYFLGNTNAVKENGGKSKHAQVRTTDEEKARWKAAARMLGYKNFSDFARSTLNEKSAGIVV